MGTLNDPEHLDYIALSGHKMYAPFGTGALIGRRDTFLRGEPEYRGGGTIVSVTSKQVDWALPPDSNEAGSPNVIGAVALARAARTLKAIGLRTITAHEAKLTSYALRRLGKISGVTLYGETDPTRAANRSGVIPFTVKGIPHHLVSAILGFEWGIGVRSGCFCAQPYVMSLLHLDANRVRSSILHNRRDAVPGLVRISFGLYNTSADVDILVEALTAITKGHYRHYTVDPRTGSYTPDGGQEEFLSCFAL
jgi:selenocysteine lyase/cysteine desulfurase